MSNEAENVSLTEILDTIKEDVDKNAKAKITLGSVTRCINQQGFGVLLLAPAGLLMLPTGAVPGVPIVCALFITMIAGQLVVGREDVWLPRWMRRLSLSKKKFNRTIRHAKPYAEKIDDMVQPRFPFLTSDPAHRLVAAICIALCIPMAIIGFIPFLPMLLSVPIVFFALGMCVKDGFLTLCGLVTAATLIVVVPCIAGFCF
jgi:hypothetical protein